MPALAKPPVRIPRFKPHQRFGAGANVGTGANAGAGAFSIHEAAPSTSPAKPVARRDERLDCLAHDARNVLAGLALYCDLLAAPGVLVAEHRHYAPELEGIARAATGIIEKIAARAAEIAEVRPQALISLPVTTPLPLMPVPVTDAAAEVCRLRPLLAAIAGPSVQLTVDTMPCPGSTALAVEDLARVLVNLVRNAADAMPTGGRIRITAQYGGGFSFLAPVCGPLTPYPAPDLEPYPEPTALAAGLSAPRTVLITVADSGPGIPDALRERVFEPGFSTREGGCEHPGETGHGWPSPRRRGLGLGIVRSLVESAGGTIVLAPDAPRGARFEIALPILDAMTAGDPVTSDTYLNPAHSAFATDSRAKGCIKCQ